MSRREFYLSCLELDRNTNKKETAPLKQKQNYIESSTSLEWSEKHHKASTSEKNNMKDMLRYSRYKQWLNKNTR